MADVVADGVAVFVAVADGQAPRTTLPQTRIADRRGRMAKRHEAMFRDV